MKSLMNTRICAQWGGAASVVAALAGCGGSGDAPDEKIQAGEVLTFSVGTSDGKNTESHFLVHGISPAGHLVAQDAPGLLPDRFVMLPTETPGKSDVPDTAALRVFYQQLWQAIQAYRGNSVDSAMEIDDYDVDIASIYRDFHRSELPLTDYVAFYEQLDQEPFFAQQEMTEEGLAEFLAHARWSPGLWLQALQTRQWDWPRFLKLMAQRGEDFAALQALYTDWEREGMLKADDFIARYVGSPRLKQAMASQFAAPHQAGLRTEQVAEVRAPQFVASHQAGPLIKGGELAIGLINGRYTSEFTSHIFPEEYLDKEYDHYRYFVNYSHDFGCNNKVSIHGRAKITHVEVNYRVLWVLSHFLIKEDTIFGISYLHFGENFSNHRHSVQPYGKNLELSRLLAKSLNARAEIKEVTHIKLAGRNAAQFTLQVKYNVSNIFNSRSFITKTTIRADPSQTDNPQSYCDATTIM